MRCCDVHRDDGVCWSKEGRRKMLLSIKVSMDDGLRLDRYELWIKIDEV